MVPLKDDAIRLPDGRRLAYTVWGDRKGATVFFFHGTPHSRLWCPDETVTASSGVRLLTVDRPGMGGSDVLPRRTFADWPNDVVELADALGVDEFGVIAWSGGGPYAAVCAARILGCGEVFGDPIPPNLCGGAVKMRVLLTTPLGELPGIMTVICVIGPKAPSSVLGPRTDGVMLNVPGIINFNHSAGGDNVYIQTS